MNYTRTKVIQILMAMSALMSASAALADAEIAFTDPRLKSICGQMTDNAFTLIAGQLDYFLRARIQEKGVVLAKSSALPVVVTNAAVCFEMKMQEAGNQKLRMLSTIWDGGIAASKKSYEMFRVIDEAGKESRNEIEVGVYWDVLKVEPSWLPALVFGVKKHMGWWRYAANEGMRSLEYLDPGSPMAGEIINLLPFSKASKGDGDVRQRALEAITQYHRWLRKEGMAENGEVIQDQLTAALLCHAGQPDKAREMYRAIIEKSDSSRPLLFVNRLSKRQGHRLRGVIATTFDPTLASSYYCLARLYEAQGRLDDAAETVRLGLTRSSGKSALLLVAAAGYADKKGNTEQALCDLRRCIAFSPEFPPAHILLAEIAAKQGDYKTALTACADTAVYCYGWNSDLMDRVNAVLDTMAKKKP